MIAPDTTNVKAATKHANVIHYDYNFATDGDSKVSFYDVAYASSVLQKTNQATEDWKRDGYSCYPEPPYDNTYNLNYNVSECADAILPPSSKSIFMSTGSSCCSQYNRAVGIYKPFGLEYAAYLMPISNNVADRLNSLRNTCMSDPELSTGTWLGYYAFSMMSSPEIYKMDGCPGGSSGTIRDITLDEAIEAWKTLLSTPEAHDFVVCPHGHGLDTHRIWEVLLLGSVPIVKTSTLDDMFEDLPVLIVEKWEDISVPLLRQWQQTEKSFNDIDAALFPYWQNLLLDAKKDAFVYEQNHIVFPRRQNSYFSSRQLSP